MGLFEDIEREVLSLTVTRNREDFSGYDAINSRPLLLFGIKCGIATLTLASILFTSLAFRRYQERNSWMVWLSIILLLDFTLRSLFCLCWYLLPRYPISKAWLERGKETLSQDFQSWYVRATEPVRVKHERVAFNEADAEPSKEKAGSVLGSYGAVLTSFWRAAADREIGRQ